MITEVRDPTYMTTADIEAEIVHLHSQKIRFAEARKMMEAMPRAFESYQQGLEQSYLPDFQFLAETEIVDAVMEIYIRVHGTKCVQFTDIEMSQLMEKFGYRLTSNADHPISRFDLKILDDKYFQRYQLQDNSTLLCPLPSWVDACEQVMRQKLHPQG